MASHWCILFAQMPYSLTSYKLTSSICIILLEPRVRSSLGPFQLPLEMTLELLRGLAIGHLF